MNIVRLIKLANFTCNLVLKKIIIKRTNLLELGTSCAHVFKGGNHVRLKLPSELRIHIFKRSTQSVVVTVQGLFRKYYLNIMRVLSPEPGNIGKPLCCETGPLQGMCHDKVVQEWCVFLPYFIFFIDDSFFHCIVKAF